MKISGKGQALALFALVQSVVPANGQQTYAQMDRMLNQIYPDSSNMQSFAAGNSAQGNNFYQAPMQPQQMQQFQSMQQAQPMQQQFPMAPIRSRPFMGGTAASWAPASSVASNSSQNKPRKFNLFRTMFGDDSPQDASGNASRAQTQAGVAHNAYLRSYYGDYYTRSQAADEAYYAAEEARREADNAYYKIQSGSPGAQSYYATARAAADNAQADADSARTNADRAYR